VEQIAQFIVRGHPLLLERADRTARETGRAGQGQNQHSVAVAFSMARPGLTQYADRSVADPAVRALRARVAVEEDAGVPGRRECNLKRWPMQLLNRECPATAAVPLAGRER